MQKRNREFNVFSLSAIDLFCSGMGAIMVLTVILMPYYLRPEAKELMEQLTEARAEAKASAAALTEAQSQMENLRQQAAGLQSKLDKPFLLVAISWDTKGADVDLHVTDPSGREYYFPPANREYPGSPAKLEVDSTSGPGNEVWIHPAATPGAYRVECVYFPPEVNGTVKSFGPVEIRGVAVHRDGRTDLPTIRIAQPDNQNKVLMAKLEVSATGEVTIR